MAQSLCLFQHNSANGLLTNVSGKPSRKQTSDTFVAEYMGNFPTATELADFTEGFLKTHCNLGYRARTISNLAKKVASGKLDLERATIMMCIGFYDKVPIDSETTRHLHQIHGIGLSKSTCKRKLLEIESSSNKHVDTTSERDLSKLKKTPQKSLDIHVKRIYDKYAPLECLAFWLSPLFKAI
ncbi:hypothetical protein LIER_04080 [Lithospermum erythrorhizon]|uniref:Uncharacterized protein n=1 Tax=Lithospermum erythrorhizon TaxID=34254 RepID=A0AAV3NWT1_LITER